MNKIVSYLSMVLVLCACNDDELQTKEFATQQKNQEIYIEDGALHFSTGDSFLSYISYASNATSDDRILKERSLGVKSLQTYIEEIKSLYEDEETLAMAYPQYFTYKDSILIELIPHYYSCAANKEGIYYVEDAVCKVNTSDVIVSATCDVNTLNKIADGEINASNVDVQVVDYGRTHHKWNKEYYDTAEDWSQYISQSGKNSSEKYRITNTISIFKAVVRRANGYEFSYWIEQKIKNEKKHFPHNWKDHHCHTYIGNLYYSLEYYPYDINSKNNVLYNTNNIKYTHIGYNNYSSSKHANILYGSRATNWYRSNLKAPKFTRIYGKCTNSEFVNIKERTIGWCLEYSKGSWDKNDINNYKFGDIFYGIK